MDEVIGSAPGLVVRGQVITPYQAMRLAIAEGAKGVGRVAPNPLVGCVIVDREHRFLASGFHARLGGDHAEVATLRALNNSSLVEGAHVYVTLEPCAHQGRTPSCARTLAPLKPASVTYAVEDPNPLVAGKGAAILREAGVVARSLAECTESFDESSRLELIEASEELAEIFLHNHRSGEPFVAVKVASTLDGQMAFRTGESKWITSAEARLHAQTVRAKYDAVAIGATTFLTDDPSLNIRHPAFHDLQNRAVVFDPEGGVVGALAGRKLVTVRPPERVVCVVGKGLALNNSAGVTIVEAELDPSRGGRFDMKGVLSGLKSIGVTSMMIEGGAGLIGAFFDESRVQRLHLYQAPVLFGGRNALAWSRDFGVEALAQKIQIKNLRRASLGPDLYLTGRVQGT